MSLTKFCIYHQPRTGSTMLWGILGNHPEVLCEREIFHHIYEKGVYSKYNTTKEYLEELFYPLVKPNHKAFGFKLQGYQAREQMPAGVSSEGELLDVRGYLRNNNYKFIVPYRLNKLEQFISQKVAREKDVWQRWVEMPDGQKRDDPEFELMQFKVKEKEFRGWYHWNAGMTELIEKETRGMDVLKVVYEDFLDNWEFQIGRMLEFINVSRLAGLKAKTKKARERPLREWIENYEEACAIHDKIATPNEIECRIAHEKRAES